MINEDYIGWLSTDGIFYPCSSYEHISKADELAERYNLGLNEALKDDALLKHGWIKICIATMFEHGIEIVMYSDSATDSQKVFLKSLYDEQAENLTKQSKRNLYYCGVLDENIPWE